jgi:glutamyl-tRNA reductase
MDDDYSKEILPISLMVEGRPCLVVGGGKIAARKAQHLLDAGAVVTVVAPELGGDLKELVDEKQVIWLSRAAKDSDMEAMFVVFAATDDKFVNKHVLSICHQHKILCCSVDGNWDKGDFVTPAIIRNAGLTVSVSTGGRSCRRSRLVKNNLARHMDMVESADLVVIGTSHHHLPLEIREKFHLAGNALDATGEMLCHVWGIHEFAILNTCNRIEILAILSPRSQIDDLLKRILPFYQLPAGQYYFHRGMNAFSHMSMELAGMLSQSQGENNIVGQVKDAVAYATAKGWSQAMMQEWLSSALHVSKTIRNEVGSELKGFEVEDVCHEFLNEMIDLAKDKIMVIGAGTVGTAMIKNLTENKVACVWVYHQRKPASVPDSVELCQLLDMPRYLGQVRAVVCATASPEPVLGRQHVPHFAPTSAVCVIDLGIPRNVEPELAGLHEAVTVHDLTDLKEWWNRHEGDDVEGLINKGMAVAQKHSSLYGKIIESFQGGGSQE